MRSDVRVAVAAVVAALAGTVAHARTVRYWFVGSDTVPLIDSARVAGPGDLAAVATSPLLSGTRFVEFARFYRPLSTLTYALDYHIWGLDPAGYHLTTLLLHAAASALAVVALAAVTRRTGAAALGGLLFAAHPLTAEVVPVASRRQDVLVTALVLAGVALFARSRRPDGARRTGSPDGTRWAAAGAVGCYALALLAKETAVVFVGLAAVWVALERERPWGRTAVAAAARAVAPLVVVTVAYLGVRLAVLGGLGGYAGRGHPTPRDLLMVLVEYPLTLWYTHGVVGYATLPGAGVAWRAVLAVVVVAAVAVVVAATSAVREGDLDATGAAAVAAAGALVAVPAAVAVESVVREWLLVPYGAPTFLWAYPRPGDAAVGLLLVVALSAGVLWAGGDPASGLTATDRRALAFFAAWLAGPLALFLQSGVYTHRSGYLVLAPATGTLAVLLAAGSRGLWRSRSRSSGTPTAPDAGAVVLALVVVVPLAATSPLVHDYGDWETAGTVNEVTLTGVETAVDGTPRDADVTVTGLLRIVADRGCAFPQAKTVQYARPGTLESWLRLHGHERRVTSRDDAVLDGPPDRVLVEDRGMVAGTVSVAVGYEGAGHDRPCLETPWGGD